MLPYGASPKRPRRKPFPVVDDSATRIGELMEFELVGPFWGLLRASYGRALVRYL
jgi:hypothetical protein